MLKKQILAAVAALAISSASQAKDSDKVSIDNHTQQEYSGAISHEIYGKYEWCKKYICSRMDFLLKDGHKSLGRNSSLEAKMALKDAFIDKKERDWFMNSIGIMSYRRAPAKAKPCDFKMLVVSGNGLEKIGYSYVPFHCEVEFQQDEKRNINDSVFRARPLGWVGKFLNKKSVKYVARKFGYDLDNLEWHNVGKEFPLGGIKTDNPEVYSRDTKMIAGYFVEMIEEAEKKD